MTRENPENLEDKGRDITLGDIDRGLARLKVFETDLRDGEVESALRAMHTIIDPRFEWFNDRDIVVTYHGSLQYHDPVNLDVDLDFVGFNLEYSDVSRAYWELEKEFTRPGVWPRQPCRTNFGFASIASVDRGLRVLADEGVNISGRYNKEENEEKDVSFYPELGTSIILSSVLLYEAQRPLLNAIQVRIRERLLEYRWLREGVLHYLDEVLEVRKVRRLKLS